VSAPAVSSSIADFLREAYRDSPVRVTLIRERAPRSKLFPPGAFDDAARYAEEMNRDGWNCYWSPNDGPGEKAKLTKSDLTELRYLHVDVDDFESRSKEEVAAALEKLGATVVDSGNGVQGFFRLATPLKATPESIRQVEARSRGLAKKYGGDDCHNADRLMRIPGTTNYPNETKRKKGRVQVAATLLSTSSVAFALEDFPAVYDDAKPAEAAVRSRASVDDLDRFGVSDRIKALIVSGREGAEAIGKEYPSDSEAVFAVVCELARCEVPDELAVELLTDSDLAISAHVLRQGDVRRYAARQIERAREATKDPDLEELNSRHFICANYGGRTRVMTEEPDGSLQDQSFENFVQRLSNRRKLIPQEGKPPREEPLGKWFLSQPRRRQFERVVFAENAGEGEYNLYRGLACKPGPGECPRLFELFDLFEHGGWVLDYFAHAVQKPFDPPEVALVFRGGQGTGKTFLAQRFGELFGPHFITLDSSERLLKNFNAHLANKLVVFGDEVFAAPKSAGVLKSLVTGRTIMIEPKGVNAFEMPKRFRLILASNEAWVVPTDLDDRRFLVLDFSDSRKNDRAFFGAVRAEWESGGREAFLRVLLERDLSGFDHRARPETRGLLDQKLASLRPEEVAIDEMLRSGEPVGGLLRGRDGSVFISTSEFMRASGAPETAVKRWGDALRRIGREGRESYLGRKHRGVWLPPLGEARARWTLPIEGDSEEGWGGSDDAESF